jgi:IclR family acetate operon transcriptional repressor
MVQSVERAFAILDAVSQRPAGLTALADRLELPKSTVARLLSSLEQVGAVERFDGRRWRVGPSVEAFARTVSPERSLAALARPTLAELVSSIGEDAGLGLPDGYHVLYADQVECDHPVQVRDWTGTRAPMHAVPSGLVLMADWPDDALDAYVAHGLPALTPRTVVDPSQLRERLGEARRDGHAWGREEFVVGINSVAAPVHDARGNALAAIHAHGPSYRFPAPGDEERVVRSAVQAAAAISRLLARDEPALDAGRSPRAPGAAASSRE